LQLIAACLDDRHWRKKIGPRIARVRITSGDAAPGPNDNGKHDLVMMNDFLYGEPQPLQ